MKENKEDVFVTIVCTVYNHEKYIKKAIDGFLIQKCNFKFNIYIQDDCSVDGSKKIIEHYEQMHPDIIKGFYLDRNIYSQGISPLFNLIENVESKYIAVCEGDDYWIDENKLQKQVDFLESNPDYVATYHNVKCVDVINNVEKTSKMYPYQYAHDCTIEDAKDLKLNGQTASIVCKNIFKKMTDNEKKAYNECTCNGDMKLSILFCYLGKVHFFADIMAVHPRNFTGESWTAKTHNKNLSLFQYNSVITANEYVKTVFNDSINVNKLLKEIVVNALIILIKRRKIDDFHILMKLKKMSNLSCMRIIYQLILTIKIKLKKKIINKEKILYEK